jgi:catechol 2,3-dioxygenase-like lactoylglutathione lyase family enzyme
MDSKQQVKSLRAFIGAKDYQAARSFYRDLGFEERVISATMSLFTIQGLSFYLQDYYVKDWVDNTMILSEVEDVDEYYSFLQRLELDKKYKDVRLMPIRQNDWGKECFLIDPSGVLWHFAEFANK